MGGGWLGKTRASEAHAVAARQHRRRAVCSTARPLPGRAHSPWVLAAQPTTQRTTCANETAICENDTQADTWPMVWNSATWRRRGAGEQRGEQQAVGDAGWRGGGGRGRCAEPSPPPSQQRSAPAPLSQPASRQLLLPAAVLATADSLTGARARMSAQETRGSGCRRSAHSTHMKVPDATAGRERGATSMDAWPHGAACTRVPTAAGFAARIPAPQRRQHRERRQTPRSGSSEGREQSSCGWHTG